MVLVILIQAEFNNGERGGYQNLCLCWNRVRTMTYPDGEVVTYHYNAAGQVERLTSNKQERQSVIVDRIGYDKKGHTVYMKLSNWEAISLQGSALDSFTINSYIS